MAVSSTQIRLSGLARKLVQDGLLAQEIAEKAADQATKDKSSLVSHLVNNKILDSYTLANVASQEFGIPLFDIAAMDKANSVFQIAIFIIGLREYCNFICSAIHQRGIKSEIVCIYRK